MTSRRPARPASSSRSSARAATSCGAAARAPALGAAARLRQRRRTTGSAFDAAGRPSGRPEDARRPRAVSVHGQERPARQLSVRPVRGAARAGGAHPRVVGHDRQADRRRLHARDIDTWADLVARSIRAAGGRPGDIVHVAYGYGLFTGGLGAHYGAERLGCTVIPMSGGQTEKQVQLIADLRPDIIMVTPSYMRADRGVRAPGDRPDARPLEIGIFGAEPWTEAMRARDRGRAGIDAVDIYGLSEVMGPGVASECVETKDGPVDLGGPLLSRDHRPGDRRGAARRRGRRAGLHVADEGSAAGDPLPHARPHAPAAADGALDAPDGRIVGRSDDMLIIRGVNVFPTQIEEIVLEHGRLSGQYQLVVSREGNLDEVGVRCEVLPEHAAGRPRRRRRGSWRSASRR